jgi:phage terminase large subunit-like protein
MTPVGRNADPTLTLDALLERSEVVTVGIDGGGLEDLLALAAIGREKNSAPGLRADPADRGAPDGDADNKILRVPPGKWLHWGHAWAGESVLERRKEIAPALLDFEADGDLTIIRRAGDVIDMMLAYAELADFVAHIRDSGLLPAKAAIGADPAGLGLILEAIAAREIDTTPAAEIVLGISQGWKLMSAIKTVEVKLASRNFIHGGSRMMAYCVGNAKVEPRGNAFLITKAVSGKAKIDPLMALLDAGALMAMNPHAGATATYLATDPLITF